MSPRRSDQKQIRITVDEDVYILLKALSGIKQSSMNKVIGEAIDYWLEADGTRELIDRHRLEGDL